MSSIAQTFARHFPKRIPAGRFLRRMLFGLAAAGALVWFAARVEEINSRRGVASTRATGLSAVSDRISLPAELRLQASYMHAAIAPANQPSHQEQIAHTASIRISAGNFSAAHDGVVRIVQSHGGYVQGMTVSSPMDSSRSLAATLAIPSAQSEAALEDLRKLGRIDEERQESENVTANSEDLDIRLKNARETETGMTGILRTATARLGDILEVEREISRVRVEIESMEAEQKRLHGRVQYSGIDVNIFEDSQAVSKLAYAQVLHDLKSSVIEGYRSAVSSLFVALEIFLSAGPSLLIWGLLLFWPARWVWRRWRAVGEEESAPAPQA